jgi:mRNA-degrading endonuclease RelE of RelBE toxin-antitoxin system
MLRMNEQKLPPRLSKQAIKYFDSMDAKTQQRIKKSVDKIPSGDIKPYKNSSGYSRLRIGDYRVLFKWISNEQILVALIDKRGQVYKKGI